MEIEQLIARQDHLSPQGLQDQSREWARSIADITGKDNGQAGLIGSLSPYIRQIQQGMTPLNGRIVLNELSEALESQWEVAKAIHEACQPEHFARHETSPFEDPTIQLSELISSPLSLLDFLKEPYSAEQTKAFLAAQPNFPAEKAQRFYDGFFYLPFDRQVDFMADVMGLNGSRNFHFVVQQIKNSHLVDEFLPPDDPQYAEAAAYQIGLKLVDGIDTLSSAKTTVKCVVAAIDAIRSDKLEVALTAQRDPERADPDVRAGYRLGRFLSDHDSGGHKVAQFGHSAPNRNDKWDRGLASSKSEAGRVSRYEFLCELRDSVPAGMREHILRVGAYEGTGSWLSTYRIELDPEYVAANPEYTRIPERHKDKGFVISVLKPRARQNGFEFIDELLELAETVIINAELNGDERTVDSVKTLIKIVQQARRAIEWETDLRNSKKQEELARQFYDSVHVIVGRHHYTAYTQDAFDFGEAFRISLRVGGEHFNHLAANSNDDFYVRQTAVAKFTYAVLMSLRGKQFNHDIHGDNGGVTKLSAKLTELGEFDNGALDINAPTDAQKKMFADCLVNAIANSERNGYEFFSSLKHIISETSKNLGADRQQDIEYVDTLMRAVISDGDYLRHMKPADAKQALLGIVAGGGIDSKMLRHAYLRVSASEVLACGALGIIIKGVGLAGRVSSEEIAAAKAEEAEHERLFYPDNPSPRTQTAREPIKPYPPLKIQVKMTGDDARWTPLTRAIAGIAVAQRQMDYVRYSAAYALS